ncbi:MAG: substrate-binding domain-containing protein [Rhizobiaceae bacterium]|nr:substrate-binding domain-containing protein [Rhizobiaceae bacterium]
MPRWAFGADSFKVAFSQADLVNDWRVVNQRDMEAAAKKAGLDLVSAVADQDVAKQLADIESMLAQGPKAMIVAPIEFVAIAPAAAMCADAGVPLITIDRVIDAPLGEGEYKCAITQSHTESGRIHARKAIELLKKKYGEPKGNVVHVQGMAGASPCIDTTAGWNEVLKDYPDIKTIATADTGFTKEGGIRVMQDFLQRFPKGEIDLMRTDYCDMALGAIDAINAAGRTEILGGILSKGGYEPAIESVIKGDIAIEVQVPPFYGDIAIANAIKLVNGETVEKEQSVPVKTFDADRPDEAKAYLAQMREQGLKF